MKKNFSFLTLLIITFFIIAVGCTASESVQIEPEEIPIYTEDIFAMDTIMTLTAYGDNAQKSIKEASTKINKLDSLWSVSNDDSEISLLNKNKKATVSPDTKKIIETAINISKETNHAFDITIYPVVKAWGFTTDSYHVPSDDTLNELIKFVNSDYINIENSIVSFDNENVEIDLGGIAKGYTSNEIINIFKDNGITSGIVSLGGNVQALGIKPNGLPWNVAIQNPLDANTYIGFIKVDNKAVITSGGYQRYFEQDGKIYHHILDTTTGKPAENNIASVTIVSEDGTIADGLSTSLFVMGKEKAIEFWQKNIYDFDIIFVMNDGEITITKNLEESFVNADESKEIHIISK